MNKQTPIEEYIEENFNSESYDTDAMLTDAKHNNLTLEQLEKGEGSRYGNEEIVFASMNNGQWSQARTQCDNYGLDFSDLKFEHAIATQ